MEIDQPISGRLSTLVSSVAPDLFGTNAIKFALMLQAVSKDPLNILLVGPPTTGKTKLLKTAIQFHDKAYYIPSPNITPTILKSILNQNENGLVTFDEFGFANFHLMKALKDILISKNFMMNYNKQWTSYPMRTSIIVADTPKNDNFDPYTPFEFQIKSKIDTWLFDFIFLITTKFVEEDIIISKKIGLDIVEPINFDNLIKDIKLAKQIQITSFDPLAKEMVKDFYVECRQVCNYPEINERNLHSMINIAESIAKLNFESKVTKEHVSLMKKFYFGNLMHRRLVFTESEI